MIATYPEVFSGGAWEALTTQGSEVYSPLWAPIIGGEVLVNGGLVLAYLYMAYLFFTKRSAFPKWFIGIAVFGLVFVIVDALAVKLALPSEPMLDPDTLSELASSAIVVAVWVPYMLVSKRVRATFTRG